MDSSSNKCDQCGKCFAESSNLKKHKMVHRGQKFHCKNCGRTFSRHWELTIHESKPCMPEAADECQANEEDGENICVPKKPCRNGGKRKHAKGQKLHACKLCPQAYDYAVNLERHLLSHTGERPHECEVCNERFFRSYTLKVHMTKHTGEKPYDCKFCGKRFNVPYLVTRHMRTHTGERPYKCGVCKRCFTQSGNLMAHKRIHTGGKPYVCEICGTRFTHSPSLKKHQRSKDACKAAAEQSRGLSK